MPVSKFRSLILAATVAAVGASAADAAAFLPLKTFADYSQVAPNRGPAPKLLYYKNEDVSLTTSVTTKTPIYTTVSTPVYTTVQTPVYNSRGVQTGTRSTRVQTGTVESQKISGYNSVVTKSTNITPRSELYTTNGTSTAPAAVAVKFNFLEDLPGSYTGDINNQQNALYAFSALSTSAPIISGSNIVQTFESGSISFTRATPVYRIDALGHIGTQALTNLLTISFQNATLFATAHGTAMSISASTPGSTLSYSSDFRNFVPVAKGGGFDFSIAGTASSTPFGIAPTDPSLTNVTGSHSLSSFRVTSTGSFSAAVPEPASWALMLVGFGATGAALRRRGKASTTQAA